MDRIEVGDLVVLKDKNNSWRDRLVDRKGIVKATPRTGWWVANGLIDVNNCLISGKELKVVKKRFLPKKYKKYLLAM